MAQAVARGQQHRRDNADCETVHGPDEHDPGDGKDRANRKVDFTAGHQERLSDGDNADRSGDPQHAGDRVQPGTVSAGDKEQHDQERADDDARLHPAQQPRPDDQGETAPSTRSRIVCSVSPRCTDAGSTAAPTTCSRCRTAPHKAVSDGRYIQEISRIDAQRNVSTRRRRLDDGSARCPGLRRLPCHPEPELAVLLTPEFLDTSSRAMEAVPARPRM